MKSLGLIAILGLIPTAATAAPPIASGSYADALLIGYEPATKTLTGYFDMQRGEAPSFSCIFYLEGTMAQAASGHLRTYFPKTPASDLIEGRLEAQSPTTFWLALKAEHGGCMNVEPFADGANPADFQLDAPYPWTSVRVVKAAKAYFYAAPAAAEHGRTYVVQGDGLGVRARQGGWLKADYVGGEKPVSGWVREEDLYPAAH